MLLARIVFTLFSVVLPLWAVLVLATPFAIYGNAKNYLRKHDT